MFGAFPFGAGYFAEGAPGIVVLPPETDHPESIHTVTFASEGPQASTFAAVGPDASDLESV